MPYFKVRDLLAQHQGRALTPNYALYSDLSNHMAKRHPDNQAAVGVQLAGVDNGSPG